MGARHDGGAGGAEPVPDPAPQDGEELQGEGSLSFSTSNLRYITGTFNKQNSKSRPAVSCLAYLW